MKSLTLFLNIGLVGLLLLGCSTPRVYYDDTKVALIRKDATTEGDLMDWFGPATSRTLAPDGSKILTWNFAPAKDPKAPSSGHLEVRLNPEGKVSSYSASGLK